MSSAAAPPGPPHLFLQAACGLALAALSLLQLRRIRQLRTALDNAEEEAKFTGDERRSERAGRVKAERELRALQLRLGQLQSASAASVGPPAAVADEAGSGDQQLQQPQPAPPGADAAGAAALAAAGPLDMQQLAFPLRPVGLLRSCFSRRNGTPRQPLLVPAARARLTLRAGLSADFFAGLTQYSHCWVLYVFHENTDLQRLWQGDPDHGVRVPRLDGGRMGVFATRSPHRPCPIGLSVARVVAVEGRTLVLGGADVVDGSPVLDIKPYVPFCDDVPGASAPPWVAARADDEPLSVGQLRVPPAAEAALRQCWWRLGARSQYSSFEEYRQLVAEVLSRDIRSVTQRLKVPQRAQAGGPAGLSTSGGGGGGGGSSQQQLQGQEEEEQPQPQPLQQQQAEGHWKVVLDGIELSYDVEGPANDVVLRTARVADA